jgi:hypothetical protein
MLYQKLQKSANGWVTSEIESSSFSDSLTAFYLFHSLPIELRRQI